jgi:RNA-directed DNA polymerase
MDLYRMFNGYIAGWVNYYAKYYKSAMYHTLRLINEYLVRWAMQKSKKLRSSRKRAWAWLARIAERYPRLFAHWRLGVLPA